jgi:GTPase
MILGQSDISLNELPPECHYGCVEYKRQLTDITEEKRTKLYTQLLWRIHEGGGWCIYFNFCRKHNLIGY